MRANYDTQRKQAEDAKITEAISQARKWGSLFLILENKLCLPEHREQIKKDMAAIYDRCFYLREVIDRCDDISDAVSMLVNSADAVRRNDCHTDIPSDLQSRGRRICDKAFRYSFGSMHFNFGVREDLQKHGQKQLQAVAHV